MGIASLEKADSFRFINVRLGIVMLLTKYVNEMSKKIYLHISRCSPLRL
jgi:hypothetical protein